MPLPLIYTTATMLAAMYQFDPAFTFLRDRYFPTDPTTDLFSTEEVLMDIKDGVNKMAPVVLPRKKGITVARDGYRTERITPPTVAPDRMLTMDDLNARGFGEALFASFTPQQREAAILAQDLLDLEKMHDNREEFIAARCMMENGYVLKQYADKYGTDESEEYELHFYEGADNPCKFTPSKAWSDPTADILGDLGTMVKMLTRKGKAVSEFVGDSSVIEAMINNEKIYKMLDNRRMNLGNIDPSTLPEGASYYGSIVAGGRNLDLFSYDVEFYDSFENKSTPVFAPGEGVLTAPGSGRGLYGAVTQMEDEDNQFHTYTGTRVPKYITDSENDVRKLRMTSRPLLVPRSSNPWVSVESFK